MKYLKMELHTHTVHSDGTMLPETLVRAAAEREYAGIVSTDHNTVSAIPHIKEAAKGMNLKIIDGIEWTTFFGHFVVSGGHSKVDWRDVNLTNIDEKIAEANAYGDAVTLAHPTRIGGHICCGCHNDYDIKNWNGISAVEAWSRFSPNVSLPNIAAKELWLSLLDKGYRIAAVYGYDWHNRDEGCPPYAATYVGIDGELSNDSFVKAVRAGRTYISEGLELKIDVTSKGKSYEIGGELPQGETHVKAVAAVDPYFSKLYKINIEGMRVIGTSANYEVSDNQLDCTLNLKSGHFRIEVFGCVEGAKGELAFTSAYYVK